MRDQSFKSGDVAQDGADGRINGTGHATPGDYLDCLADISTQLLSAPDPWSVMPVIIDWLRHVTEVDRCYLIETRQHEEVGWQGVVRFESIGPGITPRTETLYDLPSSDRTSVTPDWWNILYSGNEIRGWVKDLSPAEQPPGLDSATNWTMLLPLMVSQANVGYVGFDICHEGHELTEQAVSLLRAAVNIISAALERQAAERALLGAHVLLTSIMRSAGDIIIIATDLKFRIKRYSTSAEKLFGFSEVEVIGRRLDELGILELPGQDLTADFLETMIGGSTLDVELEVRDPAGEYRTVEIQVAGMLDERNTPTGYLLTAIDVTEDRRLQRRTLQSERMESVGMLAGGVAHDFNNILMGILGYASLAKDVIDKEHPAYRMLATIEQSGERAAGLTNELLAYARGGKYQSVAVRLDDQVMELLNILATNLPRGIQIEQKFVDDLPFVLADPVQIQQVIMNLCLNAGDAIRDRQQRYSDEECPGRIMFRTDVTALDLTALKGIDEAEEVEPGRFVVLTVEDTGCGMSEETLQRMFEPFFTTKFTGRGLGLAAVEGIIRNHGGFMLVRSTVDVGTCFTIYLPVATIFDAPVADEPHLRLTGAETILFVDDEEIVRQLALLNLTNLGYQVLLATSGREAVNTYREHGADISLIIMDMSMPGLSAVATIDELCKADPKAVILMTSGYDEFTAKAMGDYSKIRGFLQKPYTPEAMSRAVRNLLNEAGEG